jgi:hypothetical protein
VGKKTRKDHTHSCRVDETLSGELKTLSGVDKKAAADLEPHKNPGE